MASNECAHLMEFKEFLTSLSNSQKTPSEDFSANCVTSIKSVVRRRENDNDTYRVSKQESRGELVAAIWQQLGKCPKGFRVKLLQRALVEMEKDVEKCEIVIGSGLVAGEESATQYDLTKMQKFVTNRMDKIFINLSDNAEMEKLKNLADEGLLCDMKEKCMCQLEQETEQTYAAFAVKNKPRKMEDRHVCLEQYGSMYGLKHKDSRFFGVFDGHSGSLSASYAKNQLPQVLAEQLKKIEADLDSEKDSDYYRNVFEVAFLKVDERFAQKRIISGTTSVCALITHSKLLIAWVGDSKALLVGKRGTQLQLVKPHKPECQDERRRIEAAGGTVINAQGQWRVNGILNVARSIGDYSLEAVIAEPDFVDVPLNKTHDFLVLGTDGLWDHVPETFIIDTVYECLNQSDTKLDDIPKLLAEAAKERDSQDNITVVVVLLKPRKEIGLD
ncbi:protein phosphatase 1L [Drosophila tropicalis]|uniref:protein phosphatase 1L n=1 Tax=Drosophila tropicalis TaxID=46794 RepID=UPI0035AB88B3